MSDVDADPRDELLPPHNLEAEQGVLGSLLQGDDAIAEVADFLAPEDFYRENHGQIYRAALNLFREGEPIDNVTLAAELEKLGVLDRVGGRARLAELQADVPTSMNITSHGTIVHGDALKRRVIAIGQEFIKLGHDGVMKPGDVVNLAQSKAYALGEEQIKGGLEAMEGLLRPALERIEALMENPGHVVGIPSGYPEVDRLTNGAQREHLWVLAGRPSMGKTALGLCLAMEAAVRQHKPVAFFSLEMSKTQIIERMLCQEARVDAQRVQRGQINDNELERLTAAMGPLGDAPLHIDDSPLLNDLQLRLRARAARDRLGIEMVIVDYLQLLGSHSYTGSNIIQRVSEVSRQLKALARELKIPVVAISQLSRAPEQRPDKRPILSDLRESGSIEQDADIVMFLYRDDYYQKDSEKPGVAEVILAKNRIGPTGTAELFFEKRLTRFENLDRRRQPEQASA